MKCLTTIFIFFLVIASVSFISAQLPSPTKLDNSKWDIVSSNLKDYKIELPKATDEVVCISPKDVLSTAKPVCKNISEGNFIQLKTADAKEEINISKTNNITYKYKADELDVGGFNIKVYCNDVQLTNISYDTHNSLLFGNVKFNIDTNGLACNGKLTFRQNRLELNCGNTARGYWCDKMDYSDIENSPKNKFVSKDIAPVYYDSFLRRIVYNIENLLGRDIEPISYDINYYGNFTDFDPVNLNNGLLVHFKMNDNSADTVILNNIGNYINATAPANTDTMSRTGKIGNAIYFNRALSQKASLASTAIQPSTGNFTLTLWAKTSPATVYAGFLSNRGGSPQFAMNIQGGKYEYYIGSTYYMGNDSIVDNLWHFIAMKRTDGKMNLTVDNYQQTTSGATNTADLNSATTYAMGAYYYDGSGGHYLNGSIDDFRYYNRALSDEEISAIWNNGAGTEDDSVPVVDNDYPIFSNPTTTPANNTAYVNGASYGFNITITSTNATAGIEFAGVNYSISNISSRFNITLSNLGAGTYPYYYWARGNGTLHNYNVSSNYSYTIAKATPTLTYKANGGTINLSLVYPQQVNISAISNYGTVGLDKNNVNYLSNNALNVTLGVGEHIFRANVSGNQNYSNVGYSYYNITITPAAQTATLNINESSPIIYETNINITCNGQLFINNANRTSIIAATTLLGAGNYNVSCQLPATQNYTYDDDNQTFNVNKYTTALNMTANPSWNVTVGNETTITGIDCPAQLTSQSLCVLYRSGVIRFNPDVNTLLAGNYIYIFNTSGNQNYTAHSVTNNLTINSAPSGGSVADQECPSGFVYGIAGGVFACRNETIYVPQVCPAKVNQSLSSWEVLINGTVNCQYIYINNSVGSTTYVVSGCKLTKRISDGYFPYGKFGCAIEFI